MFLNTLSISNTVVVNIVKNIQQGGFVKPDKRGTHKPSSKTLIEITEHVVSHISSFPTYDCHYSRERSGKK